METDRIYNEDCLEGMKRLPDNSIDAIITDPPYCLGLSSNGVKPSAADYSLIKPFWTAVFAQFKRVLKPGKYIYLFTDWRTYPRIFDWFRAEFDMKNLIVWDFEFIKCGYFYRFSHELIMFGINGKGARQFASNERDVWRLPSYKVPKRQHPAQKPVELIEKMIVNSTAEGELVLDAFMGSGTTAVAAINTGRHFIGFELSEEFHALCERRIAEAIATKKPSGDGEKSFARDAREQRAFDLLDDDRL